MNDDLDRFLSEEEDLVPSSGFAGSVMDAVRREAVAPPAIPFPWRKALPGLAAWVLALGSLLLAVSRGSEPAPLPPQLAASFERALANGAGWLVLALLISFASVRFCLRLARGR